MGLIYLGLLIIIDKQVIIEWFCPDNHDWASVVGRTDTVAY